MIIIAVINDCICRSNSRFSVCVCVLFCTGIKRTDGAEALILSSPSPTTVLGGEEFCITASTLQTLTSTPFGRAPSSLSSLPQVYPPSPSSWQSCCCWHGTAQVSESRAAGAAASSLDVSTATQHASTNQRSKEEEARRRGRWIYISLCAKVELTPSVR